MRTLLPVVAAVLLVASGCGDDPGDPVSTASESPSTRPAQADTPSESTSAPTQTSTPTKTPKPTEPAVPEGSISLTTDGLAEGAPPAVPYLAAVDPKRPDASWRLVRPDGSSLRVPDGGFSSFAPMGDGLVGISADGEGPAAVVVDGAGKSVRRAPARGYGLAVSPDRTIVAWLGANGGPQVIEGEGSRSYDFHVIEDGSDIGAITGRKTCREVPPDYGCTIFVNDVEGSQAWLTTTHGIVETAGKIKSVADAASSGVIGVVSSTDQGSCSGLWKKPGRPVWTTCDYTLSELSPDGSRVLGTDPYLDGLGQRTLAFLDSEGRVIKDFRSPQDGPTIVQTAWEDADHALAVVADGRRWSVLRLGVDGSVEYALAPVRGDDVERPFVLPAG